MSRTRAEWWILSFALLPIAAAAVVCLWARAAYREQVRPFREDGERLVTEWLDRSTDGGAGLREAFTTDFGPFLTPVSAGPGAYMCPMLGDVPV